MAVVEAKDREDAKAVAADNATLAVSTKRGLKRGRTYRRKVLVATDADVHEAAEAAKKKRLWPTAAAAADENSAGATHKEAEDENASPEEPIDLRDEEEAAAMMTWQHPALEAVEVESLSQRRFRDREARTEVVRRHRGPRLGVAGDEERALEKWMKVRDDKICSCRQTSSHFRAAQKREDEDFADATEVVAVGAVVENVVDFPTDAMGIPDSPMKQWLVAEEGDVLPVEPPLVID